MILERNLKKEIRFWTIQGVLTLFLILCGLSLKLSLFSILCGGGVGYAGMELLRRFFSLRKTLLLFLFRYLILFFLIYFIMQFVDGLSFLFGISTTLLYLIGLCVEVLKYDSL